MFNSPAKRHLSRVRAAEEAIKRQGSAPMADATEFHLHMIKLQDHRVRLKQIQSEEGKAELKRTVLDEYSAYLSGVLAADAGGDDPVVTTLLVWSIDAGAFDQALVLGGYVLRHGLKLTDSFVRTPGCLIAEEIAEAAFKAQTAGTEFDSGVLAAVSALTAEQDMPDQVRAKLYLASGRAVIRTVTEDQPPTYEALSKCVSDLTRAVELDKHCGGKKDLEQAQRLLKKHSGADGTGTAQDGDTPPADQTTDNG